MPLFLGNLAKDWEETKNKTLRKIDSDKTKEKKKYASRATKEYRKYKQAYDKEHDKLPKRKDQNRLKKDRRKRNCDILEYVSKETLLSMYNNRCAYCSIELKLDHNTHIDHMIPIANYIRLGKRFPYKYDTVAPACATCNLKKHTKTPVEFIWERS